jgi:hypothetical protein
MKKSPGPKGAQQQQDNTKTRIQLARRSVPEAESLLPHLFYEIIIWVGDCYAFLSWEHEMCRTGERSSLSFRSQSSSITK